MIKWLAAAVLFLIASANASPDTASTIIALERAALDRSDKGDYAGYVELSAPDLVYFDPFLNRPVVGLKAFTDYCMQTGGGGAAGHGEMIEPRVRLFKDAAVLTFNYDYTNAKSGTVTHWNATEVYRKRQGQWRIVSTHWSFAKPPPDAKTEDTTQKIIAMETAALERWTHGDPSGFLEISAPDVVYFDPVIDKRMDGLEALTALYESVRGKLHAERFELIDPKVQITDNMAVLTFNYVSWGKSGKASRWNCTEVYRHDPAGWRIIQTHWSATNLPKQWDEKKKEWLMQQKSSN